MPGFDGDLDDGKHNAERRNEAFGALPVLLMALHAALQIGDATAVSVAQYSVLPAS